MLNWPRRLLSPPTIDADCPECGGTGYDSSAQPCTCLRYGDTIDGPLPDVVDADHSRRLTEIESVARQPDHILPRLDGQMDAVLDREVR